MDDRLVFDRPPLRAKRCRHGVMLYLATDRYVGGSLDLYGEFSEAETALFAQIVKPGMTVLDLGANMGAHTVYFAQAVGRGGRVIAFETQRIIHQILCANVVLNAPSNVFTHQACVGREAGNVLVPPLNYGATNNFGGLALGAFTAGETVPQVTLDSLALDRCHFVKIDIEGMEGEVPRRRPRGAGAAPAGALRRKRPPGKIRGLARVAVRARLPALLAPVAAVQPGQLLRRAKERLRQYRVGEHDRRTASGERRLHRLPGSHVARRLVACIVMVP
ncbi:MAG: FkbM family methyltransferase [Stellaceae bacterium]